MAAFKIAFNITGGCEGGYSFVGTDLGGETYKGISRKWNPYWEGWALIDMYKAKAGGKLKRYTIIKNKLLDEMVETLYYKKYWTPIQGDKINSQRLANILYDWYVTSEDDAVKALQLMANCKVDGDLGPKTLKAVNELDEDYAVKWLKFYRGEFYHRLVKDDPRQAPNLEGWLKRNESFA